MGSRKCEREDVEPRLMYELLNFILRRKRNHTNQLDRITLKSINPTQSTETKQLKPNNVNQLTQTNQLKLTNQKWPIQTTDLNWTIQTNQPKSTNLSQPIEPKRTEPNELCHLMWLIEVHSIKFICFEWSGWVDFFWSNFFALGRFGWVRFKRPVRIGSGWVRSSARVQVGSFSWFGSSGLISMVWFESWFGLLALVGSGWLVRVLEFSAIRLGWFFCV